MCMVSVHQYALLSSDRVYIRAPSSLRIRPLSEGAECDLATHEVALSKR